MKKIVSLFLFFMMVYFYTGLGAYATSLPANTPVKVQAKDIYCSSVLTVGDEVHFTVTDNVTSNNAVAIKKGTNVKAKVVKVNKRGRIGIPGRITIDEFQTTDVNGKTVPLSGTVVSEAKSKMGLSITLSVLIIPLFLLMHGKDTQILQDAQYTLYTTSL